nr:hypothetical protein [Tanacetum cinerariifolium]
MPEHPSDTKVLTVKMKILLMPTSNKLLKDSNYLIHSYRVVCFETFRLVPAKSNSYLKGQIKLIHNQGDVTKIKISLHLNVKLRLRSRSQSMNNLKPLHTRLPHTRMSRVVERDLNIRGAGGRDRLDEVFAPVARIKAIRIFLAFASYMGFIVYQMDVKSAFLYGTINEEVYVTKPPGFVDSKFLNKRSRHRRGAIDKTLFMNQDKKDIMLVQVYVDDIIFGSTKKSWCDEFKELMKRRFQMNFMGELNIILRLQTASTPIETQKPLVKDEEAADVYVHLYRYLKGQPKWGLWYPKVSSFDLKAYSGNDYAGANLDRKSTTGGCQFLSRRLISWQCKKQTIMAISTIEAEYVAQSAL